MLSMWPCLSWAPAIFKKSFDIRPTPPMHTWPLGPVNMHSCCVSAFKVATPAAEQIATGAKVSQEALELGAVSTLMHSAVVGA